MCRTPFENGTNGAIFALMSEAYPLWRAPPRKTCYGTWLAQWALSGRSQSALLSRSTLQGAIGFLASIYMLDIIATLSLIPELKGRPLE